MKWHREQYMDMMTFGKAERPMLTEIFGPLVGLPEEWTAQGALPEEVDLTGFHFDWVETVGCGGTTGPFGLPAEQVLAEDNRTRITRDGLGRTMKLIKRSATLPLPMDHPVSSMEDWDHRIPNGTPIELYRYYVKTAREIMDIPEENGPGSWKRMAF